MKRIKIFALVEGKIIDELPDRPSGTYIRIHNILNELRKFDDIKLISIPYKYNLKGDRFKDNWFQRRKNFIYSWIVPVISFLTVLVIRPHYLYFSYPQAVGVNALHTNKLNFFIIKFCKKFKIKTIMYSHDWMEQSEASGLGKHKVLSKKLEEELVKLSDILLVVSSKYPEYETAILPGGFNEKEFENLRYKIHKERFNIAYVGNIVMDTGVDLLVDAIIRLHKKYPFIKLYIFGAVTVLDNKTKEKIEETGFIIQKVVPRTKLISYFSKIDVFAYTYNPSIPYNNNTRPTKFFEYIGSEIPFIATKCDGLKMISDGKGFLWVNYSAKDFCEKLEYLLKNPQKRMRLSKELHELKKDNGWEKRADRLHEIILQNLIKEGLSK